MVLGRIEIGEGDVRPDRNDRQEGMKLYVLLRHREAPAGARRPGGASSRIERDNRVAHRMSAGIDHPHRKRGRGEGSGQERARREQS